MIFLPTFIDLFLILNGICFFYSNTQEQQCPTIKDTQQNFK